MLRLKGRWWDEDGSYQSVSDLWGTADSTWASLEEGWDVSLKMPSVSDSGHKEFGVTESTWGSTDLYWTSFFTRLTKPAIP